MINITLQRKAKGENLLEKVCDHINLLERDYFGLTYEDKNDPRNWVELDKRIGKFIKSKIYSSFYYYYYEVVVLARLVCFCNYSRYYFVLGCPLPFGIHSRRGLPHTRPM